MDKSIKINLAGVLFQVEEDAYKILRDYLKAIEYRIKGSPGGNETLDDIEARIAEIFQAQKGVAGIIIKENVEAMIELIGKPEDFDQEGSAPGFVPSDTARRRLYRNPDGKIIAGVSSGISAYLNTDPVWIRIAFIILCLPYGIGFFVYIALWISLPSAYSESQKRELFGSNFSNRTGPVIRDHKTSAKSESGYQGRQESQRRTNSAINEVFEAIGKGFYILFRVFLVIIGLSFLFAGIGLIVTFIMAFFFNIPWFFFEDSLDSSLFYAPDFLNFFLTPGLAPWVMVLSTIVILLPLIALIYWGIRMIFWFRAKDWIVSLIALVIWVISTAALTMILFSQGISFAESASQNEQIITETSYDTLYLKIDRKTADLRYDKKLTLPDGQYTLYMDELNKELYGSPELNLYQSDERYPRIEVEKYSHGKTQREAAEKAASFKYNYRFTDNTVYMDQYYEIPQGYKWSVSNIDINLYIPDGTVIWIDKGCEDILDNYLGNGIRSWEAGGRFWVWTEDGLTRTRQPD